MSGRKWARIGRLVDRILDARLVDPAAEISELERQIDGLVAALYGQGGRMSRPIMMKEWRALFYEGRTG